MFEADVDAAAAAVDASFEVTPSKRFRPLLNPDDPLNSSSSERVVLACRRIPGFKTSKTKIIAN